MEEIGAKLPKFSVRMKNEIQVKIFAQLVFVFFSMFTLSVFSQSGKAEKQLIKTVVIDAGHGGKDPGCHGNFAHEKIVCLEIALKLGALIKEKYPDVKVVYTRDKDVFVELIERANIANRNKADLFICIHANAGSAAAFGTETYVLGLHRTEAQQKVMERENSIIALEDDKGAKYKDFDMSPDAIIAKQLQGAVYLNHSILFAENLQREFKKIGRYDRGVKQAGFLVLYKTTMPSVLIETGFLTNPTEEKFLGVKDGQDQMAHSMFKAFENYKNQLEGKTVVKDTQSTTNSSNPVETPNPPVNNSASTNNSTSNQSVTKDSTGLIYRVQIHTSDRKTSLTSSRFKGLEIFEYQQDNLYKYCTGMFQNDLQAAKNYKNELIENGFQNAFVVAFFNGERISIEKAIKLAEK
ncbi:MAG: N-acetylmuramoyl-L-alanine amidase [Flavobacteriales bacterium]|nr:N-acetylmuramoyl-L-alanine amidase [Flavobacteriales bacterium]